MVGPRIFTIPETNALIPQLTDIFSEVGELKQAVQDCKLRINALELIWGAAVRKADNPDHGELKAHMQEMAAHQTRFENISKQVAEMGGHLKGLDPPLVDFYGVREGLLVLWCWTLGESEISHWHHVDEGFSARQPLA